MKSIAIFGGIAVILLVIFGMYVSASNTEVGLRNRFAAQQAVIESSLDKTLKTINQTAQISKAEVAALKDIIIGNAQARKGGSGSLATLVHEAVPNVNLTTLQNLQNIVAAGRDGFDREQRVLADIKLQHDNVRTRIPSSFFVGSREPLKLVIISSSRVKAVIDSGEDNDTDLDLTPAKPKSVEK